MYYSARCYGVWGGVCCISGKVVEEYNFSYPSIAKKCMRNCHELTLLVTKQFNKYLSVLLNHQNNRTSTDKYGLCTSSKPTFKLKQQFRSLQHYAMPPSIELVLRKRLNYITVWLGLLACVVYAIA